MSDSDDSGDEREAFESHDIQLGSDEAKAQGSMPKLNADLRMDKLPEAPKMLSTTGHATNTGPKGVKADFELAKRNMASIRMREDIAKARDMEAKAKGPVNLTLSEDNKASKTEKKTQKKDKDDALSDEDEEDDEAFQKYKLQQFQAVQAVQNSLPVFGSYDRLGFDEFASLVKDVHELVYVVAHIYENHIKACAKLNVTFEELAPQFDHVRFVRVRSSEAFKNYSELGLPTLIIYKGGKMVHNFVRVTDNLSAECGVKETAEFLQKNGVLKIPTGFDAKLAARNNKANKTESD